MIFLTDLSVTFLSFYLCLLFLSTHSNVFPKIPSFAQCSSYKAACLLSCKWKWLFAHHRSAHKGPRQPHRSEMGMTSMGPFYSIRFRVFCSRGKRQKAAAIEQTYLGHHGIWKIYIWESLYDVDRIDGSPLIPRGCFSSSCRNQKVDYLHASRRAPFAGPTALQRCV